MSTQYRLVQSGKTASGGCSAGQGSSEPVAPRIYLFIILFIVGGTHNEIIFGHNNFTVNHQYQI
jgi:carbohydrate-binding DOMON domain-containing protein